MKIAPGLVVEDLPGGGVRLRARDWPFAWWVGAPALLAGVPLVAWSTATSHWIELGGGTVFTGFGAFCAWLTLARRRDLTIRGAGGSVAVRGRDGRAPIERDLAVPARLEIRAFPVPEGAPDLADRGGDLVLAAGGADLHLARRVGPAWRAELDAARRMVAARIPCLDG